MTIKIDLRKILQEAQNKARSGIPMDEAISMAVWDHFADQESANTAMAMVSTALLEFDPGKAGTLEEVVQNMLQAIETSAHPGVITEEIESEHPALRDCRLLINPRMAGCDEKRLIADNGFSAASASGGPNPVKLESGLGKLIFLLALAALAYWLFL